MKNIHIIPTYKLYAPSRLFYKEQELVFTKKYEVFNGVHIYITSDEEIKERDWYFKDGIIGKCDKYPDIINGYNVKKIILTTDQDLIKDGVQAIDDEFLEWFVKNPSCEEVEVEKTNGCQNNKEFKNCCDFDSVSGECWCDSNHKIIIPKEEPAISEEAKKRAANYMSLKGALEPKQETLEEAAERLFKEFQIENPIVPNKDIRPFKLGFIYCAKWQKERMYSEEEVLTLLNEREDYINSEDNIFEYQSNKEWFNKFKKK